MLAFQKPDDIARLRFVDSRLYAFACYDIDLPCLQTVAKNDGQQHCGTEGLKPAGEPHGSQAFFGSTSIRPFISMCMAWQNHEQ